MSGTSVRFLVTAVRPEALRTGAKRYLFGRLRGKPVVITWRNEDVATPMVPTPRFPGFAAEANQMIMTNARRQAGLTYSLTSPFKREAP